MKFFSVLLFTLFLGFAGDKVCAQEPQFLDGGLRSVEKKKHAQFVRTLEKVSDNTYTGTIRDLNGNVKITGTYFMTPTALLEQGVFTFYYPDGSIESRGAYEKGVKVGNWERYTSDGTRKPDRYYNPESVDMIRAVMENK
jgi:hypothetical protein